MAYIEHEFMLAGNNFTRDFAVFPTNAAQTNTCRPSRRSE